MAWEALLPSFAGGVSPVALGPAIHAPHLFRWKMDLATGHLRGSLKASVFIWPHVRLPAWMCLLSVCSALVSYLCPEILSQRLEVTKPVRHPLHRQSLHLPLASLVPLLEDLQE